MQRSLEPLPESFLVFSYYIRCRFLFRFFLSSTEWREDQAPLWCIDDTGNSINRAKNSRTPLRRRCTLHLETRCCLFVLECPVPAFWIIVKFGPFSDCASCASCSSWYPRSELQTVPSEIYCRPNRFTFGMGFHTLGFFSRRNDFVAEYFQFTLQTRNCTLCAIAVVCRNVLWFCCIRSFQFQSSFVASLALLSIFSYIFRIG